MSARGQCIFSTESDLCAILQRQDVQSLEGLPGLASLGSSPLAAAHPFPAELGQSLSLLWEKAQLLAVSHIRKCVNQPLPWGTPYLSTMRGNSFLLRSGSSRLADASTCLLLLHHSPWGRASALGQGCSTGVLGDRWAWRCSWGIARTKSG